MATNTTLIVYVREKRNEMKMTKVQDEKEELNRRRPNIQIYFLSLLLILAYANT